jgi:hypothetical protein
MATRRDPGRVLHYHPIFHETELHNLRSAVVELIASLLLTPALPGLISAIGPPRDAI